MSSRTFPSGVLLQVVVIGLVAAPSALLAQQGFSRYQARVNATQSEQPHWITPLVAVTPRLEQELRTDFVRQTNATLSDTWNLGNSKGIEFIPERHVELSF